MKKIIIIPLLFFTLILSATNYYVKNGGNNALSGTSDANAWETIAKVNSSAFLPGDSILFKKGNIFCGYLIIPSSGNASNRIVFGAYGTGDNPILTPNDTITGLTWTPYGSDGIYSTTDITWNPGNILINGNTKINKLYDGYFSSPNPYYSNYTNLDFLAIPTDSIWSYSGIYLPYFWDGLDALYCYNSATGTTYIRFRDGSDPNDLALYVAKASTTYPAIKISSKYYITIQNLHIIGGEYGIYVVGVTSITSNNVIIEDCYIESSNVKTRISSSGAVIVRNCTYTNNYLSPYSPGPWDNGTEYIHDINFHYYSFFKLAIDNSESTDTDSAIQMTGGMSDNCSFYNNNIYGCVNGIVLFGHNMNCYGNTIDGTASVAIFINPCGPTYVYDNYLTDVNMAFRFGGIDRLTYLPNVTHYLFRNRVYNPNAGRIMYLHYDNYGPSVSTAYIYHNSFIGIEGIQCSAYLDDHIPYTTGFVFINNIISIEGNYVSGVSNLVNLADVFEWYYNWYSGFCYGSSSTPVWMGDNNIYFSSTTYWDHSIDPPDYTDTRSKGSIDKGIDISVPFTFGVTNYSALPRTFAYSGAPDIGYYESEESIKRKVKRGGIKVKHESKIVYY